MSSTEFFPSMLIVLTKAMNQSSITIAACADQTLRKLLLTEVMYLNILVDNIYPKTKSILKT